MLAPPVLAEDGTELQGCNVGKEPSFQTSGTVWHFPCGCGHASGGHNELPGGGLFWGGMSPSWSLQTLRQMWGPSAPSTCPCPTRGPGPPLASYSLSMASGFSRKSGYPIITIMYRSCGQSEWWGQAPIPHAPRPWWGQGQGSMLGTATLALAALRVSSSIQSSSSRRWSRMYFMSSTSCCTYGGSPWMLHGVLATHHPSRQPSVGCWVAVGTLVRCQEGHGGFVPTDSITYLGFAGG